MQLLGELFIVRGRRHPGFCDARKAVEGAASQVQVLANYVDLLARCQKQDDAARAFERLRNISAQADLDVPVMQRLKPLEAQKHLGDFHRLLSGNGTNMTP